jgi:hypothetical protein
MTYYDIIKLFVCGRLIPFWLWIVRTPNCEFYSPLDPTWPMEPTPPTPADIYALCAPNCLMVRGLFWPSFPDTFGLLPFSLTMPALIPIMELSPTCPWLFAKC